MRWILIAALLVIVDLAYSVEQPNTKTAGSQKASKTEQRGSDKSPLTVKILPAQDAEQKAAKEDDYRKEKAKDDKHLTIATVWLAGVTTILALFTALLWWATYSLAKDAKKTADRQAGEMKESLRIADVSAKAVTKAADAARDDADIARDAMIAGERAFVFPVNLQALWDLNNVTGLYHWTFCPIWQNSGDTPTKNMTMHTV